MKKFFQKSEVWFAVAFIVVYVVCSSVADQLSEAIHMEKVLTVVFQLVLAVVLLGFIRRNGLAAYYALTPCDIPAKRFLYYVPLAVLASVNLWFGVRMNMTGAALLLYAASMLLSGFLEELIFRGLLFRAMAKDNAKTAILVSSLTFGIGHLVNLVNGSGAELIPNLCQVCYAVAIGYAFVILAYRGRNLRACILTHAVFNALSAFSNEPLANRYLIPVSAALVVLSLGYAVILTKALPEPQKEGERK